ncbi:MAG: InlB B-repeat-containing protein, partial [Verrucomicrobiales bacterium]
IASNDPDENPYELRVSGAVREVVAAEDFEDGFGDWLQAPGMDFEWSTGSGGTPSFSTGPAGAASGAGYIFTEASGNYSMTAAVDWSLDLGGMTSRLLRFRYHMFGSWMGDLHVDIYDGAWNYGVWSALGEQHDDGYGWSEAVVDLDEFDHSGGIIIRLRGVTGTAYASDMAVDLVEVLAAVAEEVPEYVLAYSAGAGGALVGVTSQTVVEGGDGTAVTAVADAEYHFAGWSDGVTENPRQDLAVAAAVSVTANFELDGYADWAAKAGLTGGQAAAGAVPFGDGVENLLKFAFHMDGGGPDVRVLEAGSGTSGLPVLTLDSSGGSPVVSFEFLRMKGGGRAYAPERAGSRAGAVWEELTGTWTVTEIDEIWERVRVEQGDGPGGAAMFFRVVVTEH